MPLYRFSPSYTGTVWVANSATASSAYANGLRYVPLRDAQSDYIEWQHTAPSSQTISLQIIFGMSGASAANLRLRLDKLVLSSGGDPTTAATTGTAFTLAVANDTLIHTVTSSDSADLNQVVTAGQLCYWKFYRLGSDGADTHTSDMRIIEIRVA